MNTNITYDQFNVSNFGGSEPKQETTIKGAEKITYNEIKLHYNYGTTNEPVISDLYFELPEVAATGIRMKEEEVAAGKDGNPYKKVSYSMMLRLDLSNNATKKEMQDALDKLDEVHSGACQILAKNKGKVKMYQFDPLRPGGEFKNPVYWPRDEVTGEKINGKNPSLWVKLRTYKNNKTLFTDLNGAVIDWKLLQDVDILCVPLLHFEKIYVGAKASLQVSLASAIILKIVPVGTETRQVSTLERLKAKYGNSGVEAVETQLAELRMTRQEQLTQTATNTEFGSTDYGTMHSVTPGNTSTSSSASEQASLQDFLSNAPTINSNNSVSATTQQVPVPMKLTIPAMKIN